MTEMPAQLALFTEPQAPPPDYSQRSYSVGYWDLDKQRYVPYRIPFLTGLSVNLKRWQLRRVLRWLRWSTPRGERVKAVDLAIGYGEKAAWRVKRGDEHESDWSVLIERTDGRKLKDILKGWKR